MLALDARIGFPSVWAMMRIALAAAPEPFSLDLMLLLLLFEAGFGATCAGRRRRLGFHLSFARSAFLSISGSTFSALWSLGEVRYRWSRVRSSPREDR